MLFNIFHCNNYYYCHFPCLLGYADVTITAVQLAGTETRKCCLTHKEGVLATGWGARTLSVYARTQLDGKTNYDKLVLYWIFS